MSSTSRTKSLITSLYSLGGDIAKRVKMNIQSIRTLAAVKEGAGVVLTNSKVNVIFVKY
jgi:hypothetical protein